MEAADNASIEIGSDIEIILETRDIETKVRWFKGPEVELRNGDRFSFKQIGYSHRLLIKDMQLADEGSITAVAESDKVSIQIAVTGELTSKLFSYKSRVLL